MRFCDAGEEGGGFDLAFLEFGGGEGGREG